MITLIKGTKSSQDVLLRAAAAISGTSGIVFHKKTLVMQVADNLPDIEFLFNGHTKESESTTFGNYEINTEEYGMDSLLIRAEAGRVTREQFASLVDSISKSEEELDVAPRTMTADFETNVSANADAFAALLRYAAGTTMSNTVYDNCVIVVSGLNKDIVNICRSVADVCITVVTPGRVQIPKDTDKGNGKDKKFENKDLVDMVLVYDYEHDSVYNASNLKQAYGIKELSGIPHNFLYNDACEQGQAYNFLINNLADEETDYSYGFISAVRNFTEGVYKHGLKQEENYQAQLEKAKVKEEEELEKEELKDGSIGEEYYEEKQGLFGKTVEKSRFVVNMNADVEEDLSTGIQFEEMEKDKGFDELAEEAEEASKKEKLSRRNRKTKKNDKKKVDNAAPSIIRDEEPAEECFTEETVEDPAEEFAEENPYEGDDLVSSADNAEEGEEMDKNSKEYRKAVIAREKAEIKAAKAKNKKSFFAGLFGRKAPVEATDVPELMEGVEDAPSEEEENERQAYEMGISEEELENENVEDSYEEIPDEEPSEEENFEEESLEEEAVEEAIEDNTDEEPANDEQEEPVEEDMEASDETNEAEEELVSNEQEEPAEDKEEEKKEEKGEVSALDLLDSLL